MIARGRIGIVDAALVRWLAQQRARCGCLITHVTHGVFEPLMPKAHLEEFLTALEPVDEIITDENDLSEILRRRQITPQNVQTLFWPEDELLDYSVTRICKQSPLSEGQAATGKLTTLDHLRERYGPSPRERRQVVGLVSGSFDLIHPGHVRLMRAAKRRVDVLVVLTMSTASIQQQEKNCQGDRPIYDEGDRAAVLSALRMVDHLVLFDDRDCRPSLQAFCPNYYVKSVDNLSRPIVQAEAALVKRLGGETIYPASHHPGYSSTSIIRYVRQVRE